MDFDGVIAWLTARLGRQVVAATQGAGEGVSNTSLSIGGPLLRRDDGDVTLIDPPPGRVEAFAVGSATLVLLEGDFVSAGSTDFGTGGGPLLIQATFGDLLVSVAEVRRDGANV
ncbi:MAG TPA: hypothetical protein VNT03_01155 [Baekduia sp.]|nr:hypothetical protein [Baekduia sp.]